ncbi:hypothetical protein CF135_11400 [Aeromonas veronii]|uniref:hypothetical protein n=3 Tax=Aeromonas veronii TaxID=654 RepID=UPI00111698FB|nr:hypothetical protein CF135_11400 [Aeromonas veronii]HDO1310111.1 hypothetical protein [Aeromonas veronii]
MIVRQKHLMVMSLIFLFSALPLGYFTAPEAEIENNLAATRWQLPTALPDLAVTTPDPLSLSRFWPVEPLPDVANSAQKERRQGLAAEATEWRLVAVIRQGSHPQALVLSPKNKLLTVSVGAELDPQQQVTGIEPDRVRWTTNTGKQGSLVLYPKP